MLSVIAAEAQKLTRHPSAWFLVWIFPIWAAAAGALQIIAGLVSKAHPVIAPVSAEVWARQTGAMLDAPSTAFGRILIAGFVAVVFAGEYGWNTWKLIIPARSRIQLILAKWIVVLLMAQGALVAADLISVVVTMLRTELLGPALPQGLSAALVVKTHLGKVAHAALPLLTTLAFASLVAIVTRAILPTVMVSIGAVLVEPLLAPIALVSAPYAPTLVRWLLTLLPFYHTANLEAASKGARLMLPLAHGERLALSSQTSLWILCAWILVAAVLTLTRFNSDDHN